jgi:alkylation response protein AidB-like acyl-CoA dehydrogenase
MNTLPTDTRAALSSLTEQERMFQEAVQDFADAEIAPRVMQMDEAAQIDASLLPQLFDMGIMGIEIPEEFGGTGADFFTSILIVEALSRVDPSVGTLLSSMLCSAGEVMSSKLTISPS